MKMAISPEVKVRVSVTPDCDVPSVGVAIAES
jgi:hypothetical protein